MNESVSFKHKLRSNRDFCAKILTKSEALIIFCLNCYESVFSLNLIKETVRLYLNISILPSSGCSMFEVIMVFHVMLIFAVILCIWVSIVIYMTSGVISMTLNKKIFPKG